MQESQKIESEVYMILCPVCNKPIETLVLTDKCEEFRINSVSVHEDCWYEELGRGVEKRPDISGHFGYGIAGLN